MPLRSRSRTQQPITHDIRMLYVHAPSRALAIRDLFSANPAIINPLF
jgi:hypothetical protein